eukprot:1161797-Pelagomonas_calceolata.AAC.7
MPVPPSLGAEPQTLSLLGSTAQHSRQRGVGCERCTESESWPVCVSVYVCTTDRAACRVDVGEGRVIEGGDVTELQELRLIVSVAALQEGWIIERDRSAQIVRNAEGAGVRCGGVLQAERAGTSTLASKTQCLTRSGLRAGSGAVGKRVLSPEKGAQELLWCVCTSTAADALLTSSNPTTAEIHLQCGTAPGLLHPKPVLRSFVVASYQT